MRDHEQRSYAREIIACVKIVQKELVTAGHDAEHDTVLKVIELSYQAQIANKLDSIKLGLSTLQKTLSYKL